MRIVWTLFALVPILIGLSAVVGWIAHVPVLIQLFPGDKPLVFNAVICLFLSGIALLFLHYPTVISHYVQATAGVVLLTMAGLTLVEILFNVDFHIDQVFMTSWAVGGGGAPGRMSPNSAFSYIFCGLTFLFLLYAENKIIASAIEVFIFILFLIGILSVTGYVLNIEFLYAWYGYLHMSLLSAICITAISMSLWGYWRSTRWAAELYEGHQDTKIILLSSAILLCVTLIVSLASFVTMAQQQAYKTGETFQRVLNDKTTLIKDEINHVFQVLNVIHQNTVYQKELIQGNSAQKVKYQDVQALFLSEGFAAVHITDHLGNTLASLGDFVEKPVFYAKLTNTPSPAALLWKDGWYLQVTEWINPGDPRSGNVVAEWPLYNIDIATTNNQFAGKTSTFIICAEAPTNEKDCFSTRLNNVFHVNQNVSSQFLPAEYGLAGQTGVMLSYAYQQEHWIAAYGPIDKLGLSMVVAMDTAEIYQPIRENLSYILPVIAISIVIGLVLLRLQVIPLVRRVVKAEQELLRTNRRLQESEERYALAVRGSHVGLWDWKVDTDQMFYSPYFKTMMGYAEHEVPPSIQFLREHLHPDDKEQVFKLFKDHMEHYVPFDTEFRLRQKSGEYHWYRAVGEASRDDQGNAIRMAGSLTDVTERKKSAQRLTAQYAVIRILSEAAHIDAVASHVMQTICELLEWEVGILWLADYHIGKMRCIGFWSAMAAHQFENVIRNTELQIGAGLPGRVWNIGQPAYIFDIVIDKHFPDEAKSLGLHSALCFPVLLQNKVLGALEFMTRKKQIPDESLIKMMSAIGTQIAQFIQRRSTEIALHESEGYKTAIVESASDSIMTVDQHGMILSFNPLTSEIFGYSTRELNKKNIDQLIPGLTDKLKQNQGKMVIESEGVRNNSQLFPVEISASVMHLNRQIVYVTIIRDITERKKIEKMKNEFVSVVSHELRTPLTSIRGALGLIQGGTVEHAPDKLAKLIAIATSNCDRLLLLINDILDTEKIETGKMIFHLKVVDINHVVEEAIAANKMFAEKFDIEIHFNERAQDALVNVDSDRLIQVLTNLISNAVKFSPKNEIVIIKTKVIDSMVRISVLDQGAGIPVEFQTKIFQKFSQADSSSAREKGGTGLGLSISKSIIEKLGGTLGFANLPECGSVFYFDLPLWQKNAPTKMLSNVVEESAKRWPRILMIEDDIDAKAIVSALLVDRAMLVNVDTVRSAIELMNAEKFDLAILDLLLPDGNGVELLPILASHDIPVIVFSAVEIEQEYMPYVKAALVKTETSNQELLEAINRILETVS